MTVTARWATLPKPSACYNSQQCDRPLGTILAFQGESLETRPLHWWMESLLPELSHQQDEQQAREAVLRLWCRVPEPLHFIVNKLLTGGFRVGVSKRLISRAVAEAFSLDESLVVQRLMGGFEPSAETFSQLTAPAGSDENRSSAAPYPFFLANTPGARAAGWRPRSTGCWNGNGMGSAAS